MEWYDKYVGLPFKHLGIDPATGIDCFNIIKHIYKKELGIDIPYTTRDWCNIIDENWYRQTHERAIDKASSETYGWEAIDKNAPEKYSVITMYMGSSTITNHCALYVGNNKILHICQGHTSHISVYGDYYRQYTAGAFKWVGIPN